MFCGSLKWQIITTQIVGQFWSFHGNRIQSNFLGLSARENFIVCDLFSWPMISHHIWSTLMHASHLGMSCKFHGARNWLLHMQPFMIGHCHLFFIVEPLNLPSVAEQPKLQSTLFCWCSARVHHCRRCYHNVTRWDEHVRVLRMRLKNNDTLVQ